MWEISYTGEKGDRHARPFFRPRRPRPKAALPTRLTMPTICGSVPQVAPLKEAKHCSPWRMKVLLDLNVVLDVILNRQQWVAEASKVWDAHSSGDIEGFLVATENYQHVQYRPQTGQETESPEAGDGRAVFIRGIYLDTVHSALAKEHTGGVRGNPLVGIIFGYAIFALSVFGLVRVYSPLGSSK